MKIHDNCILIHGNKKLQIFPPLLSFVGKTVSLFGFSEKQGNGEFMHKRSNNFWLLKLSQRMCHLVKLKFLNLACPKKGRLYPW